MTGSYLPGGGGTLAANERRHGVRGQAAAAASGGIVALVPNGSFGETTTGVQIVPIAGTAFSFATVNTANPVNSCSVDQGSETGVCTANNTDVYIINIPSPGASPSTTLTSGATGTVAFTGGSCTNCGVVVDSSTHTAVIGVGLASGSGYQLLNLTNNQFGTPIVATGSSTSESWAVNPLSSLILSPTEAVSGAPADYQIFNISNPSSPVLYNFAGASAFPADTDFDSAVSDTTGIILATVEFQSEVFIADLSQSTFNAAAGTWTAPNQIQNLGTAFSNFTAGLTGIALAAGSHEALVEDEFGTSAFGALKLPATAGSGTPAVADWVTATMPSDPTGAPWQMPEDPHGLTAAYVNLAGGNQGMGLLMNLSRTYIAMINLDALLAAARSSSNANVIDPTVDLVKSGIVTFLPIHPYAGTIAVAPTPVAFPTTTPGATPTMTVTITNNGTGILSGNVDTSGLSAPFSATAGAGQFFLSSGSSTTVTIQFAPTTAGGTFSGSITITSSDPANPSITILVTGSS